MAYELAKALDVTLDYLVDDSPELGPSDQLISVTEEELTILKIVRHLGVSEAIDRLLVVQVNSPAESRPVSTPPIPAYNRPRGDSGRS